MQPERIFFVQQGQYNNCYGFDTYFNLKFALVSLHCIPSWLVSNFKISIDRGVSLNFRNEDLKLLKIKMGKKKNRKEFENDRLFQKHVL